MARGAPAEYTADILLRLIESAKVPDKDQRKELLQEVFEVAVRVEHPVKLQPVGAHTDTTSGKLSQAARAGLDTLSIQSRVVTKMLPLDRKQARDLFSRIPAPQIPRIDCTDTVIPNVSAFYQVLTLILNKGFTPDEIEEEKHIQLALSYLTGISSSLQLVPAAQIVSSQMTTRAGKTLEGLKATLEQQQMLTEVFAQRLATITESDREFHWALPRRLPTAVYQIIDETQEAGMDTHLLTENLRAYLVRHFSRTRCSDTVKRDERWLKELNKTLERIAARTETETQPITPEEAEPGDVVDGPEFRDYWQTSSAKPLLRAAKHLRFGDGKTYLPVETRLEPEWQREAADYLNQLSGWEPAYGESEIDFFHMKSGLFQAALDLVPRGDLKRQALLALLEFLSRSPVQSSHPLEYRWELSNLLKLARPLSKEGKARIEAAKKKGTQIPGLPGDYRNEILEATRESKSHVIALYGYAEEVIPIQREG